MGRSPRALTRAAVSVAASALGLVALAATVAALAGLGAYAPLVVGALLVAGNLCVVLWILRRGSGPRGPVRWVGVFTASWLCVSILPVHSFASRSSASATSSVSVQPMLEILLFTTVGALAILAIRSVEPTLSRARPPTLLLLLPIWVITSAFWSGAAPYAAVRGGQMAAVALLAWATVAVARVEPVALERIVEGYLRWFVRITLALTALGFAFGPIYVSLTRSNLGRFSWIGAHPNGSGLVLSAAIVIALSTPRSVLRLPGPIHAAAIPVLVVAMYDNHSRTAWLCTAVALLVSFTLQGRLHRLGRWIGAPALGAAVVAAVFFQGPEIWDYLLRDRDTQNLAAGNGRRELWGIGFRALDDAFDWIGGLGYGAARSVFLEEAPWAGEAHNSILSLLVSVGVVGVVLLLAVLGATVTALLAGRAWTATRSGIAITSLLVLVTVSGLANDVLAEPTIGWAVLCLASCVALVGRAGGATDAADGGPYAGSAAGTAPVVSAS